MRDRRAGERLALKVRSQAPTQRGKTVSMILSVQRRKLCIAADRSVEIIDLGEDRMHDGARKWEIYLPSIATECPHCGTEKACFSCEGAEYNLVEKTYNSATFSILMRCGVCSESIVTVTSDERFYEWRERQPHLLSIDRIYPTVKPSNCPAHCPSNITSFFKQADDALRRRAFDSSGTMARKSLDATLRKIHPDGKGTLEKKIDGLPPEIGVTPAMKEWAHQIRLAGNEAVTKMLHLPKQKQSRCFLSLSYF